MKITANGTTSFVLLNGIIVNEDVKLSENVTLQPADTSHIDLNTAISTCTSPNDIAVVAAYIPKITAQFKITAPTKQEAAGHTWNSSWDALLLSAIFHTEIGFNLQSDTTANKINAESHLWATNYHMYGLVNNQTHTLTHEECSWITENISTAKKLLENERFQTAVHCLASYRWHSMPRIKLAVLWAGIEGMFGASSEIRFRISLYIARFLHPNDSNSRKQDFDAVKKLYNIRSDAVHGSKIKGDLGAHVEESADILRRILRQCISNKDMPNEDELVP